MAIPYKCDDILQSTTSQPIVKNSCEFYFVGSILFYIYIYIFFLQYRISTLK